MTDEEYNVEGSFEYPPIPRNVEQHVAFWTTERVPDAIMTRVRNAYVERRNAWADEQMDVWAATDPEPLSGEFRSRRKEIEAWNARFDARHDEPSKERPDAIPAVLARPLIRAVQMASDQTAPVGCSRSGWRSGTRAWRSSTRTARRRSGWEASDDTAVPC